MKGSTKDLSPAVEFLCSPSIDPVEDIEESIKSESCYVMRCNVFDYPNFIEHNDLRDESETLKP